MKRARALTGTFFTKTAVRVGTVLIGCATAVSTLAAMTVVAIAADAIATVLINAVAAAVALFFAIRNLAKITSDAMTVAGASA